MSGIIKAARTRFHSHVQQGMKEWAQTNDMDSDTDSGSEKNDISEENSQDIASRQDFIHFEKFFAGLNYASVGLLNDILPLSRCFPPWYDVASKLINVHISCVIAVVAPAWDRVAPGSICLCPEWERTGPKESMFSSVGHDGLHLDNQEIIRLSQWMRDRASNWPRVLERTYKELLKENSIKGRGRKLGKLIRWTFYSAFTCR